MEALSAFRLVLPKNLQNVLCMPAVVLLWFPDLHVVQYWAREVFFLFHQMQVCSLSTGALIISLVNYPQVQGLKKLVVHKDNKKTTIFVHYFFQTSEKVFFLPVATSQMAPVIVGRVGNYFSSWFRFLKRVFPKPEISNEMYWLTLLSEKIQFFFHIHF